MRAPAPDLRLVFRTLRSRNYRLFYAGQFISLTGTWIQQVAVIWLVYRLTGSPFLLGVAGFAGQLPSFLLSPVAGVVADRVQRRRLVLATQVLAMIQAALLAALTLTSSVGIGSILALSLFLGVINAFDMPARQSFLLDMIDRKEDLSNAIALNSSLFNGARLVGPAIAGILIAAAGEGVCFLINAVSYIAVILALLGMRLPPQERAPAGGGMAQELREGFAYVAGFAPIRTILLLVSLVSVVGMPYGVLMPIIARDVLQGGPHTMGFLLGATGAGALSGALYLASRRTVVGLGRRIAIAGGMLGSGLIGFSYSREVWVSMGLLTLVGFGMMVQLAASNTILQTVSDDDKRGRVMSFYTMAFMGMAPFGSLLAGSLAGSIGAPATLFVSGAACILGAALFALRLPAFRREVRPVYMKIGIIPEVSSGMHSAAHMTIPPEN